GFERAVHGVHEVLAVVPELEAQEVVAEQAGEQLLLPGEDAEHLPIRPGDVPELCDDQVRIALLEVSGQQAEVVILDEDERRPIRARPRRRPRPSSPGRAPRPSRWPGGSIRWHRPRPCTDVGTAPGWRPRSFDNRSTWSGSGRGARLCPTCWTLRRVLHRCL